MRTLDEGNDVMPEMQAPRSSARARLLAAAAERFYADGVQATGIDAITAAAGVAKMSLYNNFRSKDDLVNAYLQARHEEWLDFYAQRLKSADSTEGRILAVFDAYLDHAQDSYRHGFRGCGLLNAAAELPTEAPGRLIVRRHKEDVQALLETHLEEAGIGADRVGALAEHLSLLLEGAMARAGLEGDDRLLVAARECARQLLSGTPKPASQ